MKPPANAVRVFLGLTTLSFLFVLVVLIRISSIRTPSSLTVARSLITNSVLVMNAGIINREPVQLSKTNNSKNTTTMDNMATPLHPLPSTPNTSVTPFPFMDNGQTWKDHFCDEFLSNKFSVKMTPCDPSSSRVLCYGSPYDDKMGSCFIKHLAMDPVKFHNIMRTNRDGVEPTNTLWLVRDNPSITPCDKPVFDPMERYMVGGDYVKRLAKTTILSTPKDKCSHWINGTTFMFMGFDSHIYFKYLSWFSLHNGIINYESNTGKRPSLIIRIPQGKGEFTHAEYEHKLFSETKIMSLGDFAAENKKVTCFEDMVITPWAYSTSAFRCKMADAVFRLRNKCYNCNSRGLPGTRYSGFRRRALAACSISEVYPDPVPNKQNPKKIVLEIRRPYMRHNEDSLRSFHRTLVDPKGLIKGLQTGFPDAVIEPMVAEELTLCEQIKLVHDADVLMGVHGAGLVHVWWLQDHALLFELVPASQMANPSFKMLATLTGKRYHEFTSVGGSEMQVTVDSQKVVTELKKQYS